MTMIRLLIPLLAVVLSGCATMASMPPKLSEVAYKPMMTVPEPDNKPIVLAVYQFGDLTGQQKPNDAFSEMSKAVTQGASNLLILALKRVGDGKWFRVAERESLQSLLQERKLIRTTRQMTQGDKAKPLGPMLYAGAYLTGGIVGYDSNTLSGGVGHRFLGIGASAQYRQDTVTVMLRLINVVTGEVELAIMTEKTILSIGVGGDKFKYLDTGTNLLEIEAGIAKNEPTTYAVRKTIEGAVVELIMAGEKKSLWKYKPEPEPVVEEEEVEELLEEIVEVDNEIRETVKENQSKTYAQHHEEKLVDKIVVDVKEGITCLRAGLPDKCIPVEPAVSEPVKVEPPLSDAIRCESGPDHYRCRDETSFSNNSNESTSDK
ncbi:MAG: CsgG/HfaB family protein [Candidatus Pacebacteria bacterium]|nr:CsgG/HfaB family protein [Candidatus Paceibacterota bacterium]